MIKAVFLMNRHHDLSVAECHQHWFEVHGQHHAGPNHKLLGYAQHHTLLPAYEGPRTPTHDGASIIWVEDFDAYQRALETPAWQAAVVDSDVGYYGGRPVFEPEIPIAVGHERVVVDGETNPFMVKAIWTARRNPDLDPEEFSRHWFEVHGPLGRDVPGMRRYVQNHTVQEARSHATVSHDVWAEEYFDDYGSFVKSLESDAWKKVVEDGAVGVGGRPLFENDSLCFVLGRERFVIPKKF